MIARKPNSKRQDKPWQEYMITNLRNNIETMFNQITTMFSIRIHAVTIEELMNNLRIFFFAFTFQKTILKVATYAIRACLKIFLHHNNRC